MMFTKTAILSAVALTMLAGSAFAQEAPPPPKPDAPMADGGPGKRPPPPPPPAASEYAGFDIQLGRGAGIHVACGKDDIKTCVEAASSLLEKAQGMMDQAPHSPGESGGPPPPPPKKP